MPGGNKGATNVNSKAAVGRARKAETEAKKASEKEAQAESQVAKAWQDGADLRGASRAQSAAEKADEAARKRREKALLQAEEEANLGSGGKAKAPTKAAPKKKKDDLSLLENALVKDAEKKLRAKKEKEEQMKREEAEAERRRKEEEEARKKTTDPLLLNTEALLGEMGVSDDVDILVGRKANKAAFEENAASGIDAAIDSVKGGGNEVKSMKALYAAFEARMLPKMKEDYPGLRLSQYKERIFQLWQKSPENPANQHP